MITLMAAAFALLALGSPQVLLALPLAAASPAGATDIPLKTPAGWKSKTDQGATIMIPGDLAEGKVYTVLVTPLQVKAGSLDEVYAAAKKLMSDVGTFNAAIPPQNAQTEGGWDYRFTLGTLEKGDKELFAQVTALKKGDVGGIVIVISDSIETMKSYADPFGGMIRSLGGAAKPPPAPQVAPGAGTVDLHYAIPEGWTEKKNVGATVIEAENPNVYTQYRWTLVVLPSQPLTVSVRDHFKDYWKALVTNSYESDVVPLPLMARLEDGYACAFDADGSAKHKATGARPWKVSVFLLAHGNRFVPIIGILYGYEKKLEQDVEHFLSSARIPGSSNAKVPLFSSKEIAGDWSEGSASIASYVTSSGTYAGDASIYTGSTFHLRQDGTYNHVLVALKGSLHLKEKDEGAWKIDDNELVLTQSKGMSRYSLLGCGVDPKVGRFLVLGSYSNQKTKLSFTNPRGVFQASWFKAQ